MTRRRHRVSAHNCRRITSSIIECNKQELSSIILTKKFVLVQNSQIEIIECLSTFRDQKKILMKLLFEGSIIQFVVFKDIIKWKKFFFWYNSIHSFWLEQNTFHLSCPLSLGNNSILALIKTLLHTNTSHRLLSDSRSQR